MSIATGIVDCKLTYGPSGIADSTVYLTNGTDGFRLIDWTQGVTQVGETVMEVITVAVEGTDHDDLIANLRKIDTLRRRVAEFNQNPAADKFVRLWVAMKDETYQRAATVHSITTNFIRSVNRPPTSPGNFIDAYTLVIERDPLWDHGLGILATYGVTDVLGTLASENFSYDFDDYSGGRSVGGTERGVLTRTQLIGSAGGGGPFTEFWYGFRSDYYGDRARLQSFWHVSNATGLDADTSNGSDGDAYGTPLQTTFSADTTLAERFAIKLGDVTSYPAEQRGQFLVLLRAKCTGTKTYQTKLKYGFYHSGANYTELGRVKVDKTDWYLYPLGYVDIPPERYFDAFSGLGAQLLDSYGLVCDAGVLADGTGNLLTNGFMLVPADEGLFHVSGCYVTALLSTICNVYREPDGFFTALNGWQTVRETPMVSTVNPGVPVGSFSVVTIGQRETLHNKNDYYLMQHHWSTHVHTMLGDDGAI